jgi:hypothetical protein
MTVLKGEREVIWSWNHVKGVQEVKDKHVKR